MRPSLFYAGMVGFALGVSASFFGLGWEYGAVCVVLGGALGSIGWIADFHHARRWCAVILLIFLGCGIMRGWQAQQYDVEDSELASRVGTNIILEGKIVRDPESSSNRQRFVVETDTDGIMVYGPSYPIVSYGDIVAVDGALERPEAFETDTGRVFNYPRFLAKDGIRYVMYRAKVEIVGTGGGNPVSAMFIRAKHAFVSSIEHAVSEPFSGLSAGVVLGVEGSLSKDDEEAFRVASLIHIVVVSGYNITLAGDFMRVLLRSFPPLVGSVGSVVGILSYIMLTGASSTAIRAGIMACIVVLARITKRHYNVMRALMVAGFIMIIEEPRVLLYDPSFQLSFLATWGLVKITPIAEQYLSFITTRGGMREIIATTIGAQTAVTPLILFQSGTTHLLSLFANIAVLPFMPAFMMTSIATGVAGLVHPYLALPFAIFVELIGMHVFFIVKLMGMVPEAVITVGQVSLVTLGVAYGVLLLAVTAGSRPQNLAPRT